MLLQGILYGKTISAKTMAELKRKASEIANGYFNPVDEMVVSSDQGITVKFFRINKKYPNNTIEHGEWK